MAALALAIKSISLQHLVPKLITAQLLTTLDWINIPDCKGVLIPAPVGTQPAANDTSNNISTTDYGVMYSTAVGTAIQTTLAVDNALADATRPRLPPYYIKMPTGEIAEVTGETTPAGATSTITMRRGVLGTTAGVIADNDRFSIMNQIVFANGTAVGHMCFMTFEMPNDAGTKLV